MALPDPFLHELTGLKQIDLDLVFQTTTVQDLLLTLATQASVGAIKVKTDNLDVPLSSLLHPTPGAPAFDSGNVAVTNAYVVALGATVRVRTLFAMNLTGVTAFLSVTDGPGLQYLLNMPLDPGVPVLLTFGGMAFNGGVKWKADVNGAIRAQVIGD